MNATKHEATCCFPFRLKVMLSLSIVINTYINSIREKLRGIWKLEILISQVTQKRNPLPNKLYACPTIFGSRLGSPLQLLWRAIELHCLLIFSTLVNFLLMRIGVHFALHVKKAMLYNFPSYQVLYEGHRTGLKLGTSGPFAQVQSA